MEITISVDNAAQALLGGLARKADVAMSRTIARFSKWLKAEAIRQVARQGGLTQKRLRQMNRVRVYREGRQLKAWIGLRAVDLSRTGAVRHSRQALGASVGGTIYGGSFVSNNTVFIRTAENSRWGHQLAGEPFLAGASLSEIDRVQMPLLPEAEARQLIANLSRKAKVQFRHILMQNISHALAG